MSVQGQDIWYLLGGVESDLRSATAKLTELRAYLAALSIPDGTAYVQCPECGLDLKGGDLRLAEHRYVVHDVPLPEGVE